MSNTSTPTATHVAAEVRAEMARQRKTGMDLAELLGCSQSSAARRMSGETPLSLNEVYAVARWLGVSVSALVPSEPPVAAKPA